MAASNTLKFEHRLTGTSDLFGTAYYRVEYPRDWNFSSLNYFKFGLEASTTAQYIEIDNFNHGATAPKIYDLTNNKWYTGDILSLIHI